MPKRRSTTDRYRRPDSDEVNNAIVSVLTDAVPTRSTEARATYLALLIRITRIFRNFGMMEQMARDQAALKMMVLARPVRSSKALALLAEALYKALKGAFPTAGDTKIHEIIAKIIDAMQPHSTGPDPLGPKKVKQMLKGVSKRNEIIKHA